jgi:Putative Actinobacterial Holin-X, holin superfamily III
MEPDRLKDTALPHALSDAVGDLADLFQKELRLARAEISEKISAKLNAGIWMSAAAGLGLITAILAVQALVFGIASYGVALHWSCLIVAGVFACLAALAFFKGRANAAEDLTPNRTLHNLKRDIATAKEQLT